MSKRSSAVPNKNRAKKVRVDPSGRLMLGNLAVDQNLAESLKPHQVKGLKFIYDACFPPNQLGNGCILAHRMGLGNINYDISQDSIIQTFFQAKRTLLLHCPTLCYHMKMKQM